MPIIEALHPGWLIHAALSFYLISRRAVDLRFTQTKCFVFLLLIMVVHVPLAVNNYWALQGLKGMFLYFIVFLSIASFVNSYSKLIRFIDIWIIVNLFCAGVGILNDGKVPNSAFMGDENDFALVMNMAMP
ncbi:MAG: hypothetical protein MN733_36350, partial [Nitrososphaera sp.]|nr:hypothetical protein [Nitrososphaera sp.]